MKKMTTKNKENKTMDKIYAIWKVKNEKQERKYVIGQKFKIQINFRSRKIIFEK